MRPIILTDNLDLSIDNISIFRNISLEIPHGSLTAILGPNGAGKSFLLRSLAGLESKITGKILVDGHPVTENSMRLHKLLSWNPERVDLPFDFKASEVCLMGRFPRHKGYPKESDHLFCENIMRLLQIDKFSDRKVKELSSGEAKKVHIARAMASDTPIIMLDEPTANLDISSKDHVLQVLKEQCLLGKTAVVVLHDLHLAYKFADHIILLKNGSVVKEGPKKIVLNSKNILKVFQAKCQIITLDDGTSRLVTI